MGTSVRASCECGMSDGFWIGCGFAGPSPSYFPCLCETCHKIVQVNVLAKRPRCPLCRKAAPTPYSGPRLVGIPGQEVVQTGTWAKRS